MATDPNNKRGNELMAKADKMSQSSGGLLGKVFGGGSRRNEDAAEIFVQAANSYKMAKNYTQAGIAFSKSAEMYIKMESKHEAGMKFADAAISFKKGDPNEAVNCLMKAIDIYTDMGRFSTAARYHKDIAEIYEGDLANLEEAIKHYEKAADYYKGEESTSAANKCLVKVAEFSAQLENYAKAVELYEEIGTRCLDNNLLKFAAKDHFFRATLCHTCIDLLNAQGALDRYLEMFPGFADCREYKLIQKVVKCLEEEDAEGFTAAVQEYDSISRIDQWCTTMLLRIKKLINQEEGIL